MGGRSERLGLSDSLSADLANSGPCVRLDARLRGARTVGASGGILDLESGPGDVLLRAVLGGRLACRGLRISAGEARTVGPAALDVPATLLLPPGDVLRDGQVGHDGLARRASRLGKTRKKSHCSRSDSGRGELVPCEDRHSTTS